MISRPRAARPEARDRGFAGTGFVVVVATVVVALAVTAVVLSMTHEEDRPAQVERDPRAETRSALLNTATAMETWSIDNGGAYLGACGGAGSTSCPPFDASVAAGPNNRLVENGLKLRPGVVVEVVRADAVGYCLQATHEDLPDYELYLASHVGVPNTNPCT